MTTISRLDATQLIQAIPNLITLLQDAVNSGASIGFLPPLSSADAQTYWQSVANAIREDSRLLWVAKIDEAIVGTVQLDLCMRANGLHRAEVSKLMVHSAQRGKGIGKALMHTLEAEAHQRGRTTLVLDTRTGDVSEHVYQSLGWLRAGEIPHYARSANGELHSTSFFYKLLSNEIRDQIPSRDLIPHPITLRPVTPNDVAAITAIYGYQVETGTASWELVPPNIEEMRKRMSAILDAGYPYLVAEINDVVVGYSYASVYRPRAGYRFTCENSVYVDPAHQRKGIAKLLLTELIARCTAQGLRQMIAVIGDSQNIASIKLHESVGFVHVGVMTNIGFKFECWLDGVYMQRALS